MKRATGPDATYITIIAITTAAIMISMSCAMPIAVTIELIENTRSTDDDLHHDQQNDAQARARRVVGSRRASTSAWISCVALAIRNSPPPIRMMSCQENAVAEQA